MTKSELKTGMVVTARDMEKYMVYKDCAYKDEHTLSVLAREDGVWSSIDNYNDDLTVPDCRSLDIMKVEVPKHPRLAWQKYKESNYTTIWERKPPKKMTVAEIEAILGYSVEIIS